ncbi:malonic semialdehyde reductase [Aristophania vespae]|uniref:Malonic semialdehyde reductase n=1 Tax=Aristophania vespae TaxID=2697033 RepID=A0A6P1N8W9_9PROT|nr:malonic semialdehyde reductase [Aristophania vespae]QHI94985.1 malonic semialdehyde reductase [Aristophania vespae]
MPSIGYEHLFTKHHTPQKLSSRPIEEGVLKELYDVVKLGPTSGNCQPARFVFLTSGYAHERLKPALSAGNVHKAMEAPVIAIIAHDPLFFEQLPRLNKTKDLREWFAGDVGLSEETAFRNGTLQGAYLILAARALGLAAMPMSGFDSTMVEEEFLKDTGWRANFLVALGYPHETSAQNSEPPQRAPRLTFEEACLCL